MSQAGALLTYHDCATVQQAREIPAIHVVNFDWLEDTINNKRPQKSSLYYIGRKMGKEAKTRTRVKQIKQGSKCVPFIHLSLNPTRPYYGKGRRRNISMK